ITTRALCGGTPTPTLPRKREREKGERRDARTSPQLLSQPPRLYRIDLRGDVATVNPRLRKRAANEPQARLRCARPHVAELLRRGVESPHAADAARDVLAEQLGEQMIRPLVTGGEHEEIGLARRAVAHPDAAF